MQIPAFKGAPQKSPFWTTESKLAYMLLFPAFAVLLLFMFYPILYVFLMAFYKTDKLGRIVSFFGFGNFHTLFSNKTFWEVTMRSVVWTVLAVASKTAAGLVIALLLNIEFTGRRIYRTLVIIPWASSVPISAMLWQWTYNSEFGLLNYTLKATGLWSNPPFWLAYPRSAFFANLYVDIWIGIPFMAMVFLAGLQSIPKDIYESAEVDGASAWVCFWQITLPMLKRVLLIATLLSALWTFNDFNVIYILTKGGPVNKTDILITFIYKYSFEFLKFGPAAAMAVITFVILLIVSLIYAWYYFRSEEL
ncbi:binding-protein-dependent transport systems inner membrane component [Candidatus Vecturithrix granuli]|uniref:Binding-protein-dependent transport systems inner membrane component n=1 Tax=Vecturithrix granuli TaxID=1499967 RepID=A0A081BU39_VECG1|nr:binding-protein-dependent transport systems inner membrane component [Candidatus Vecturithrix granuli]